ncbi:unnamed protein product [Sympodiomycopsis kandeliae]
MPAKSLQKRRQERKRCVELQGLVAGIRLEGVADWILLTTTSWIRSDRCQGHIPEHTIHQLPSHPIASGNVFLQILDLFGANCIGLFASVGLLKRLPEGLNFNRGETCCIAAQMAEALVPWCPIHVQLTIFKLLRFSNPWSWSPQGAHKR